MFGIPIPPSPKLREYWIQRPPRPDDRAGWACLVAEADADGRAVLELRRDQGFRGLHEDLPGDTVIYVTVPLKDLEAFTVNLSFGVRPFWIID